MPGDQAVCCKEDRTKREAREKEGSGVGRREEGEKRGTDARRWEEGRSWRVKMGNEGEGEEEGDARKEKG